MASKPKIGACWFIKKAKCLWGNLDHLWRGRPLSFHSKKIKNKMKRSSVKILLEFRRKMQRQATG